MKKGQISLFIIIGIVIVVIIGLVFFVRSQILSSNLATQAQSIETVPQELRPVKQAINNCVNQVSSEGLTLIGVQGGYYNIPKDTLPRGLFNEFSNSLEVLSGLNTPYWFYETNNGLQILNIPTKEEIKNNINSYVIDNLDSCVSSAIDDLRSQGFEITTKGNLKVTSNLQDQYVEVLVSYPLDVNYKDTGKIITNYYSKLSYPLGELYDMGTNVMNTQNSAYYLENITLDVLEIYNDVPFANQNVDCVPKVWLAQDIKNNLKQHISDNIKAVTVKNSASYSSNPYYQLALNKNYNDVDAKFSYQENWPMNVEIDGGKDVLKEDQVITGNNPATKLLAGILCLNSYQFIYNIKYPTLIQLTKNGYTFQFATMVIIKNNQPKVNRLGFSDLPNNDKAFCSSTQYNSTIVVNNFETGSSLENVDVSVKCITTSCPLGKTSFDGIQNSLTASIPSCVNAEVSATKEGFNDNSVITNTNNVLSLSVALKPKHKLNLNIQVIDNGEVRNLKSDESVLMQFTQTDDNYFVIADKSSSSIELIQGQYNINSYLTVNSNNITIEGTTAQKCIDVPKPSILGLFGLKEHKCFTANVDPVNVDQVLSGGDNFNYNLASSDLNSASELTIYVTKNPTPSNVDELRAITDVIQTNSNQPEFILPELK